MPIAATKRLIVRLTLALAVLVMACSAFFVVLPQSAKADTGDYPDYAKACIWSPYNTTGYCKNGAATTYEWGNTHDDENSIYSTRGYAYRNCTDYVAWKLQSLGVPDSKTRGLGNGGSWYDNAPNNSLSRGTTPQVGDAAVVPSSTPGYGGYGHVAYVEAVNYDSNGNVTTITVSEYNYDLQGDYNTRTGKPADMNFTEFVHFGSLMTNPPSNPTPTPTPSPAPPIIAVKTGRSPDGTAIEVYAATAGQVTQGWYRDGDPPPAHTYPILTQSGIVGIDKINQADGTESLYTAVTDGVYESWWNASSNGVHSSKIVYPGLDGITLSGVRGVIAELTTESGVTVHHLYILASDGPYEAYWKDGGDGVHLGRLIQINGPVAFTHSIGPDGSEQLYVAVPTWVYEVSWFPGGTVNMRPVLNITQADIRSVEKGANLSDGSQLLYTTTSTTVWQTYWPLNGSFSTGTIATSQTNAIQALKVVTPDGIHHVYLALPDHVQEYWWPPAFGGGEIIRIIQGNIAAIAQQLDGTTQLLFTAAGSNVWESWWDSTRGPTNFILFGVTA
ncbi:MAG TPA: CHAP domain-containing protein [Ktedonobacteraceae bacterium]|nr:CHAP domain-containing protein [Ktedonobacteraceae bacterium]